MAEKVHTKWKEVLHIQIGHLMSYSILLIHEWQELLKDGRRWFERKTLAYFTS